MHRLFESYNLATRACHEARKRSEDVVRKLQQAGDLVDVKAGAIATRSRYAADIFSRHGRNSPITKTAFSRKLEFGVED